MLVDGLGWNNTLEDVETVVAFSLLVCEIVGANTSLYLYSYSTTIAVPKSPKNAMFLNPTKRATLSPNV